MTSSASALRGASTYSDAAGPAAPRPRILLIDDEPNVLEGLRRQLRRFDVTTATSGVEALELVHASAPFVIAMTDMRMPGMDGVAVLRALREASPDTIRILLTGYADLQAAIDAVNEGAVFRFLSKPCPPDVLLGALGDAVRQYQLVTAERELLEETLQGAVRALVETLSLANPMAFARAVRMGAILSDLLGQLEVEDRWEVELACMLAHVGAVTLKPAVAEKLHHGLPLDPEEQEEVDRLPEIADRLLAGIPRLEGVREIIRLHPEDAVSEQGPLGAQILRVVMAFDTLEARGMNFREILSTLQGRGGLYDPRVVNALARLFGAESTPEVREVSPDELREGMVLAADLRADDGELLAGRGQPVTPGLIARISQVAAAHPPRSVAIADGR
jgi:response regulator RpfG family c-di-GMP phosphodiesterase